MIGRGQVQAGMVIGMMIGMGSGAGRHDDRQGSGAEGGRLGLAWLGWADGSMWGYVRFPPGRVEGGGQPVLRC